MTAAPRATLSQTQNFLLQGIFAVVVVGVVLPVGLVGMFLLIRVAPAGNAISHGELYVSGGNAGIVGCVSLMAARQDRAVNAAIAALFVVTLVVVPCYAFAAYFSVQAIVHQAASYDVATIGGGAAAVIGIAVGLVFVWLASPSAIGATS